MPPKANKTSSRRSEEVVCECRETGDAVRGRGLFATRDLKVGDLILEEAPIVSCAGVERQQWGVIILFAVITWECCPAGWNGWMLWTFALVMGYQVIVTFARYVVVSVRIRSFTKEEHDAYFNLRQAPNMGETSLPFLPALMIWRCNALPSHNGKGAMFKTVCLLNHSCAPNAHHLWDPQMKKMTVYCMKPIDAGEEITISYVEPFKPRDERQQYLMTYYGFDCSCEVCAATPQRISDSDDRRARCASLQNNSAQRMLAKDKGESLREIEELLQVLGEEFGAPSYQGDACWEAYQLAVSSGDKKLIRKWASEAYRKMLAVKGPNHPDVMEAHRSI